MGRKKCEDDSSGQRCKCHKEFSGPRCQQVCHSFAGAGLAWFPGLEVCQDNYLSIEILTEELEGAILYNGPFVNPAPGESFVSDFILLELVSGQPRLLIDFGSGTVELKGTPELNDGKWHRIDLLWERDTVRMVVDFCNSVPKENEYRYNNTGSACDVFATMPLFSERLNLNTPLQLGGIAGDQFDPDLFAWTHAPVGKPFKGYIQNLRLNSILIDLGNPAISYNSYTGCSQIEALCNDGSGCGPHGDCDLNTSTCSCISGWTGQDCSVQTIPATFTKNSFIKYQSSSEVDYFNTEIQMRFRTRYDGELIRVAYGDTEKGFEVLEVDKGLLKYMYKPEFGEERDVIIYNVYVDDGEWHMAKMTRYMSMITLSLDDGEGRRYNQTFQSPGYHNRDFGKPSNVYVGGKQEFNRLGFTTVISDFRGCMDGIQLNRQPLPYLPSKIMKSNKTNQYEAVAHQNVEENCFSNNPCRHVRCPNPYICTDLWWEYKCT